MATCSSLMCPPPQLHELACKTCPASQRKEVWNLLDTGETGCGVTGSKMQLWQGEVREWWAPARAAQSGTCGENDGFALGDPSWHCEPSLGSASAEVKPGMKWSMSTMVLSGLNPIISLQGWFNPLGSASVGQDFCHAQWWRKGEWWGHTVQRWTGQFWANSWTRRS